MTDADFDYLARFGKRLFEPPKNRKYPTWKYRWFRINFIEHDPHAIGFGISFEHTGHRELSLTIWRTVITWQIGKRAQINGTRR